MTIKEKNRKIKWNIDTLLELENDDDE